MKDNLDTLAKKADALEAMVKRGELTWSDASRIMEAERKPWIDEMSAQVLGLTDEEFLRLKDNLEQKRKV